MEEVCAPASLPVIPPEVNRVLGMFLGSKYLQKQGVWKLCLVVMFKPANPGDNYNTETQTLSETQLWELRDRPLIPRPRVQH